MALRIFMAAVLLFAAITYGHKGYRDYNGCRIQAE